MTKERFFTRTVVITILLCLISYLAGAVSYSILNQEVDREQGNAIVQSIMVLAAYEAAAGECMDFETRMCVVQGKNQKYMEILEAVYGEQ